MVKTGGNRPVEHCEQVFVSSLLFAFRATSQTAEVPKNEWSTVPVLRAIVDESPVSEGPVEITVLLHGFNCFQIWVLWRIVALPENLLVCASWVISSSCMCILSGFSQTAKGQKNSCKERPLGPV